LLYTMIIFDLDLALCVAEKHKFLTFLG